MSKSLGNIVTPQEVIKQSGADILRLWVASADYAEDLRLGPEILKTNIEGFIHMLRIPYESDMWVDNVTDNLVVKAYERYSFGVNDPRCGWGEFPTS